jgi:hypothetical protein
MSIFKSTLDPTTSAQLKARESVVSTSGSRDDNFLKYTTGKNSWVRMTSFVNYNNSDALSKKYILEGGTLYNSGDDQFSLRAGVGKQSGAYASNLDINTISGKREIVRPFGLRPMPGITQASVINKSAYGSLREATVEFLAWDKHQLEELELLFMRPGYTVFLEWGWSQYLDHGEAEVNKTPSDIKIKYFDTLTLNPFDPTLTDEKIYGKIDDDIKLTKGNYDAMLGYVKNFSWQLLPNGGFQCTTVLISRGEVLSSLKASTTTNFPFYNANAQNPDQVLATMFEKILLNIIGSINDAAYSKTVFIQGLNQSLPGELYITGSNPTDLRAQADAEFAKINSEIQRSYPSIDLNKDTFIKYCDGGTEGTAIEYIKMDAFIALLNTYLIPKQKSINITNIEIPGNTPCLASEDSISIDPTTCLIKNKKARFIADNKEGFDPYVKNILAINGGTSTKAILEDFLNQGTTNLGSIGNIYISINKILTIFREKANDPDGLDILMLLQEVLKAISFALGGINDFQTHSTRSTAQIIDKYYLESGKQNDKFEFNLIGLKSICRDVKINSRIFAEQSTMIGIGAAAGNPDPNPGNLYNLGDLYTSTQQQFNKGLTDRVLNNIQYINQPLSVGGTQLTENQAYYYNIYRTLEGLKKYVTDKVLGIPNGGANFQYTIIPQPSEVSNAGNALRTIHYQLNGKDVNFKALIPFELEITLDGIGGFIIGQIFTIDNSILPQDYYNKNLGFIITGISHKLQNNDWVTELKTQICLLDTAKELKVIGAEQNKVKKIINDLSQQAQINSYLVNALCDYLTYATFNMLYVDNQTLNMDLPNNILSSKSTAETYLIGTATVQPNFPGGSTVGNVSQRYRRYIPDIGFNLLINYSNITNIETFLKKWYDDAFQIKGSDPTFPQDYNAFLSQTNTGQPVKFDLNKFSKFIFDEAKIKGAYIVSTNTSSEIQALKSKTWNTGVYAAYKRIWDASYLSKIAGGNFTLTTKQYTYTNIIKGVGPIQSGTNIRDDAWFDETDVNGVLNNSIYNQYIRNWQPTKFTFMSPITNPVIAAYLTNPTSVTITNLTNITDVKTGNGFGSNSPTTSINQWTQYGTIVANNGLNQMRLGFYDYFQRNTAALNLSIYLVSTPPFTDFVNTK